MTVISQCRTAREAAYHAILESSQEKRFAQDALQEWFSSCKPSTSERGLAQRLAYGSIQMALALDHIAKQLTPTGQLKLKKKEKVLLRLGLYQLHYMDAIPSHAAVDETVKLAKKYCHDRFAKFLNATLRAYSPGKVSLPKSNDAAALSIRYSYPESFVQQLVDQQSLDKTQEILGGGNEPGKAMLRLITGEAPAKRETQQVGPFHILVDPSHEEITQYTSTGKGYVQNATPIELIHKLSQETPAPKRILDLCAAPGGKMLLAHALYPEAQLHANDGSEERSKRLHENLERYGVNATVTCQQGQDYVSDELFDLVILDVPCSNSGVLNKRPEARWRLTSDQLSQLHDIQLSLIKHAASLLKPGGHIWYLTCSILDAENADIIDEVTGDGSLQRVGSDHAQLPGPNGWDGGFAVGLNRVVR